MPKILKKKKYQKQHKILHMKISIICLNSSSFKAETASSCIKFEKYLFKKFSKELMKELIIWGGQNVTYW